MPNRHLFIFKRLTYPRRIQGLRLHTWQNCSRHVEEIKEVGFEHDADFSVLAFLDSSHLAIPGVVETMPRPWDWIANTTQPGTRIR